MMINEIKVWEEDYRDRKQRWWPQLEKRQELAQRRSRSAAICTAEDNDDRLVVSKDQKFNLWAKTPKERYRSLGVTSARRSINRRRERDTEASAYAELNGVGSDYAKVPVALSSSLLEDWTSEHSKLPINRRYLQDATFVHVTSSGCHFLFLCRMSSSCVEIVIPSILAYYFFLWTISRR